MKSEWIVAAAQMTSVDDLFSNFEQIQNLLIQIFKNDRPQLVCFPENCLYLRIREGEKIQGLFISDPIFYKLSELAKLYNTYLHLGSVPLLLDGQLSNSSVLISPSGEVRPTYQKMHLFDIQLDGDKAIRESDVFRHGKEPSVIEIDECRTGESICYDVRFAELYSQFAKQEVDLILVPAAFLVKTGEAHWETLLRARAIESQAYLIASAQGGVHLSMHLGARRETFGHSLIIDPWGEIVGQVVNPGPGFAIAKLSRERIAQVRRQIPMRNHRRLPVA